MTLIEAQEAGEGDGEGEGEGDGGGGAGQTPIVTRSARLMELVEGDDTDAAATRRSTSNTAI